METILHEPQKQKSTPLQLVVFALRAFFGLLLGIVLATVGQEIIGYGQLSTIFVTLTSVFLILRLTRNWAVTNVLFLILFVFLLFVVLKTYISVAPGE